jgi:hypothetical protein
MKRDKPASGLSEFKGVLSDFRQLSSLAVKGVVAVPLADIWLRYGPPPAAGIAILTSAMEFAAIVWVFQAWYQAQERALIFRMSLLSHFSASPGGGRERVIKGTTVRPEVAVLLGPTYGPEDALRESEYDVEKVWTAPSITIVRTVITLVWVGTFVSLAIYLTVFITLQRRRSEG